MICTIINSDLIKSTPSTLLSCFESEKMHLVSFSFYEDEILCKTWEELYVQFFETIIKKYTYYLQYLYENQESISLYKIFKYENISKLRKPVQVKGSELYVETDLSPINILKAITKYVKDLQISKFLSC